MYIPKEVIQGGQKAWDALSPEEQAEARKALSDIATAKGFNIVGGKPAKPPAKATQPRGSAGNKKLAEARIFAAKEMPYMRAGLMSLVPVERPGLGTMAKDQYGRLYYDPAFLAARSLKHNALVVAHEYVHYHQRHARRQKAVVQQDLAKLQVWRKTVECPTNEIVESVFGWMPDEAVTSAKLGLPKNVTVEEAFAIKWKEHCEEQQRQEEERKRQEEAEKQRQQQQQQDKEQNHEENEAQEGDAQEAGAEDQEEEAGGDKDSGDPRSDGADDGEDGDDSGLPDGGEPGADQVPGADEQDLSSSGEPADGDQGSDDGGDGEAQDGGGDDDPHGGEDGGREGKSSGGEREGEGDVNHESQDGQGAAEGQGEAEGQEGEGSGQGSEGSGGDAAGADAGGAGLGGQGQGKSLEGGAEGHEGGADGRCEALSAEELSQLAQEIGGSASDGIQRPWEMGPPSEDNPGLSESDQDMIEAAVAKAIEQHIASRGVGSVPSPLAKQAIELLHKPVDPCRELAAMTKYAVDTIAGFGDFTYSRASNRQLPGGCILPTAVKPIPRITLVIDSSGSMGSADTALALEVLGSVLKNLPDPKGLRILVGGTRVEAARRVFKPDQIQILDGGGTDMGRLIRQADQEKPAPKVIICVTDGITPWCREQEVQAKVMVCLTRKSRYGRTPPEWMKTVCLHPDAK
jgi:predicted metal-dependent peptidase